jgi:alpha-tubulin suppressor-like RCC1 family protein
MVDSIRIFSWGRNSHGQLGVGNEISVSSPVEVHGLESFKVAKIAAGGHVSAVVTGNPMYFNI